MINIIRYWGFDNFNIVRRVLIVIKIGYYVDGRVERDFMDCW